MENNSYDVLLHFVDDNYSVGVHGVVGFSNHIKLADNMLKNGIVMQSSGGMLSNLQMFGQKKNMGSFLLDKLKNYSYTAEFNNVIVNVLVAVPDYLETSDGGKYFLGHFNYSELSNTRENAENNLPLNIITDMERLIPKEFVVGYVYKNFLGNNMSYVSNPKFIGLLSEEKRQIFIDEFIKKRINKYGLRTIEEELSIVETLKSVDRYEETEYYRQLLDFISKEKVNKL